MHRFEAIDRLTKLVMDSNDGCNTRKDILTEEEKEAIKLGAAALLDIDMSENNKEE